VESVDADGKLHTISPDGKGGTMHWSYPASVFTNPEIAKKAGIVGVGNTAELLERRAPKIDVAKAPDVKPEETPQAPAAEGTPPADSNANRVISPAVTSGP
jgi:hypothetical protein